MEEQIKKVEQQGNTLQAETKSKFCPLCGKNREGHEFKPCVIGALPKMKIEVNVCNSCNIVFHNARRIFQEVAQKFQAQQMEQAKQKVAIEKAMGRS